MISEILLTRTKASQVSPIYEKFINIYPTLTEFFNINVVEVEKLIKPLGLLYRANGFKKVAEKIKLEFNKKIPNDFTKLKSLFCIGDYGANAILCFGFNEKRPLIDTNFIRIFKRVFNIKSEKKRPKSDKSLWKFSEKLLPNEGYIQYNYGVLDLGGKICMSRKTKCEVCPITEICYHFINMINKSK